MNETKPEGKMEGDFDLDLQEGRDEAAGAPWWTNLVPAGWLAQGMHLITHEEVRLARQAGLEVYPVFKLKRWAVGDHQLAAGASGQREVNISPAEQAANAATLDRWARAALASKPPAGEQKPVAWQHPDPRYMKLAKAAINLLAACSENLETKPWPQKYCVPYGEVNALRDALEADVPQPEQVAQDSGRKGGA